MTLIAKERRGDMVNRSLVSSPYLPNLRPLRSHKSENSEHQILGFCSEIGGEKPDLKKKANPQNSHETISLR